MYRDKKKESEYQKQYYINNKDKLLKHQAEYRLNNPKRLEYDRKYRSTHKKERNEYDRQYKRQPERCNRAKGTMSQEDFYEMCYLVSQQMENPIQLHLV